MALVRQYGAPSYFVTFTCNPKWPEIQRNLPMYGKSPEDCPDLVARVFALKLKDLLFELTRLHVLGEVKGFVYTIEFQKRGLPHAHILLIMKSVDVPREPVAVDQVVSARLPDPVENPVAYQTVKTCMMHGPCGSLCPWAVCMEEGRCTKGYPKAFNEHTVIATDAYPQYAR